MRKLKIKAFGLRLNAVVWRKLMDLLAKREIRDIIIVANRAVFSVQH